MKEIKKVRYEVKNLPSSRVREVAELPRIGKTINLRAAKAQLSALVDLVESGEEVVLTRDGKPALRMVPFRKITKPYTVNWELLKSMPMQTVGPFSEEIVREDRDARW